MGTQRGKPYLHQDHWVIARSLQPPSLASARKTSTSPAPPSAWHPSPSAVQTSSQTTLSHHNHNNNQNKKNLLKKIWRDSDLFQILLQHSFRDKISRRKKKYKKHLLHRKKKREKNPYQQNQEKKTSTRDCEDQRKNNLNREQNSTINNNNKRGKVGARRRNTVFCAPLVLLAQWRNSSRTTTAHVARSNLVPGV